VLWSERWALASLRSLQAMAPAGMGEDKGDILNGSPEGDLEAIP